jgi:hypothetical protein
MRWKNAVSPSVLLTLLAMESFAAGRFGCAVTDDVRLGTLTLEASSSRAMMQTISACSG